MSRPFATPFLLVSLLMGTAAHAQTAAQKQRLIAALVLPNDAKISFLDSRGRPLSYDAFMHQAHLPGTSFSKDVDSHSNVVLRINAGHKAPASHTLSLKIRPGDVLPDFDLRTAQGQRMTIADFRGHYTLLSFYFAECVPCIAEIPTLNTLARQRKDFRLLTVTYESHDAALAFARQRNLRVPSLVDAQPWIDALGVSTYPALLLVDPRGHLAAATISTALASKTDHDGVPTPAELTQWVDRHRMP